jgi:hypothetical protein
MTLFALLSFQVFGMPDILKSAASSTLDLLLLPVSPLQRTAGTAYRRIKGATSPRRKERKGWDVLVSILSSYWKQLLAVFK